MRLFSVGAAALLAAQAVGASLTHKLNGFTITEHPDPEKRDLLQKYVCLRFLLFQWLGLMWLIEWAGYLG